MPMYNFGVVVDDAFMGITHVLRAQAMNTMNTVRHEELANLTQLKEHLMNTPRQILMYEALGLKALVKALCKHCISTV